MKPKILKTINFVDSAARPEFKLIPESKPPAESAGAVVQDIYQELQEGYLFNGIRFSPLSILFQSSRKCIQYYPSDNRSKLEVCNSVAVQLEEALNIPCAVQTGRSSGGNFYKVKIPSLAGLYVEIKSMGAGENRLYIGSSLDSRSREIYDLINECSFNGIVIRKVDLSNYLRDSLLEFRFPSQNYYDTRNLYSLYVELISELKNLSEIERGSFVTSVDSQDRIWLRDPKNSNERERSIFDRHNVLKLINKFCLPNMTKIELLLDESNSQIICRPRFQTPGQRENKRLSKSFLESSVYKNRNALEKLPIEELDIDFQVEQVESCDSRDPEKQREFRDRLLDDIGECIVTSVRSTAVLEAAHIKPWSICCREGDLFNMFNQNNGMLLRSDLHKLYDRGLITFYVDGNRAFLRISSSVDQRDRVRLGIEEGLEVRLLNPKSRDVFFNYHEKYIFQD